MAVAIKTTAYVNNWLHQSQNPCILHLFENVCNLTNEAGEIISVVQPEIGAGPFALVIEETRPFSHILSLSSLITIEPQALSIAPLLIDLRRATLWDPMFPWAAVLPQTAVWRPRLPALTQMIAAHRRSIGMETAFGQERLAAGLQCVLRGVQAHHSGVIEDGVRQMAGLGGGFTPSGDDLLLGVIYGLLATRPLVEAQPTLNLIVNTAVPRTTTLSAAWLAAAGRGEATELWHQFVAQFCWRENGWQGPARRILATGHSSGVEALGGFTAVLEQHIKEV